ncbi:hypothetical protein ACFRCG_12795 [Embleya sp. NPDC056575]|uniref:hypothetical protein n=1 Tax=unclassified Embleya TaxID=2699296 RepID=UPI0036C4ECEE
MAATAVLILVAGCSDKDEAPPKRGSTSAPSASQAPTPSGEDDARAQALAVYDKYRTLQTRLEEGAPFDEAAVAGVATARAVTLLRAVVDDSAREGTIIQGPPGTRAPRITTLSLTSTPPSITLEDCVDISSRVVVYRENGRPYPVPTQSTRYIKVYTVQQTTGTWLVSDARSQRDRTC